MLKDPDVQLFLFNFAIQKVFSWTKLNTNITCKFLELPACSLFAHNKKVILFSQEESLIYNRKNELRRNTEGLCLDILAEANLTVSKSNFFGLFCISEIASVLN